MYHKSIRRTLKKLTSEILFLVSDTCDLPHIKQQHEHQQLQKTKLKTEELNQGTPIIRTHQKLISWILVPWATEFGTPTENCSRLYMINLLFVCILYVSCHRRHKYIGHESSSRSSDLEPRTFPLDRMYTHPWEIKMIKCVRMTTVDCIILGDKLSSFLLI